MKVTNGQDIISKFLLSRSLFLGGGISLILTAGQKDAWIGVILGFLIGICIIFCYSKISSSINGSLYEYTKKNNFINILIRLFLLMLYIGIIFWLIIIFAVFIYSYYLPFTKAIISCAPFLFLAIYLSTKGHKSIVRVAQLIFGVGLIVFVMKTGALIYYVKIDNFLPILTIKNSNLFVTAINYAVLTTTPYLLAIDQKSNLKNNLISYTLSFITLFIMFTYIIGCFGTNLIRTFSYPEFTVLRLINFFNFIQNIENFLAINWLFDIFIALTFAISKIKEVSHYQKNIFSYLIGFIILLIVSNYIISDYKTTISIYHSFILIFLIIEIIIFTLLGIKKGLTSKSTGKYK